jgi:hypothetical protein
MKSDYAPIDINAVVETRMKMTHRVVADAQLKATGQSGRPHRLDYFDGLLICLALIAALVVTALPFSVGSLSDVYFYREARTLSNCVTGAVDCHEVVISRAPAPVLYYAVPYLFVPSRAAESVFWKVGCIWNLFWAGICVLLIRRAAASLFGERAGRVAGVLDVVLPFSMYYSLGISSEPPAFLGAVLFAYGWARWMTRSTAKLFQRDALVSLAGLTLLCMSRPNALVAAAPALAAGFLLWRRGKTSQAMFALLCVLTPVALETSVSFLAKQLPATRGLKTQSVNFSDVLLFGSFQYRSEPWDWRFWGKSTRVGSKDYQDWLETRDRLEAQSLRTGYARFEIQNDWVKADVLAHPVERVKMFAVRLLSLHVWMVNSKSPEKFAFGPLRGKAGFFLFHVLFNLLVLSPIVGAVWFLLVSRDRAAYWPLWAPWISLLAFHALVYSEPRYLEPVYPLLLILFTGSIGLMPVFGGGRKQADAAAVERFS